MVAYDQCRETSQSRMWLDVLLRSWRATHLPPPSLFSEATASATAMPPRKRSARHMHEINRVEHVPGAAWADLAAQRARAQPCRNVCPTRAPAE